MSHSQPFDPRGDNSNLRSTPDNVLGLDLLHFPTHIPPRRDFYEPEVGEDDEEHDSDSIPEHQPYDGSNALDSTTREYAAEFDPTYNLNLGAESPGSLLRPITPVTPKFASSSSLSLSSLANGRTDGESIAEVDEWSKSAIGKSMNTNVPARNRLWRSASFNKRQNSGARRKAADDGDCGICFEIAVNPIQTPCCDKMFCKDHLAEWLHGSSSDGRCPSCKTIFSFSYTPSRSYPPTPKTPGTPPVDQGFIPMTNAAPSSSSWSRYLPIPVSMPQSSHDSQIPRVSRPATPSPLSTISSSADLYSSSSSSISSQASAASTSQVVRRGPHEGKEKGKEKEGSGTLTTTAPPDGGSNPFSLAAWANPEFMGGAVERLLSLVGLTLLFYVLLSSKGSSTSS